MPDHCIKVDCTDLSSSRLIANCDDLAGVAKYEIVACGGRNPRACTSLQSRLGHCRDDRCGEQIVQQEQLGRVRRPLHSFQTRLEPALAEPCTTRLKRLHNVGSRQSRRLDSSNPGSLRMPCSRAARDGSWKLEIIALWAFCAEFRQNSVLIGKNRLCDSLASISGTRRSVRERF